MKKTVLLILCLIMTTSLFSQDSIFNYLDKKGKIVKKKENARSMETIVRKDSIWQVKKYFRNGKLNKQGYFKYKDKKNPVGEFTVFYKSGKLSRILFYNNASEHEGQSKSWFENGDISYSGNYRNDLKGGVWKYYHYNGNNACRQYFKKGKLLKTVIYSEKGEVVNVDLIESEKPKFKGGIKKFIGNVKDLSPYFKEEKIKGKIYVNFIIDIEGNITQVVIDDIISESLKMKIKLFLEKIKGWQPAIHMNRKIPYNFNLPLSFN